MPPIGSETAQRVSKRVSAWSASYSDCYNKPSRTVSGIKKGGDTMKRIVVLSSCDDNGKMHYHNRYYNKFGEVPASVGESWPRSSAQVVQITVDVARNARLTSDGFIRI